jgi:predicted double-glycine peptidase
MLLDFLDSTTEEVLLRDLLKTSRFGTPALNILMLNASLPNTKAELHRWLLVDLQRYLETKRQPCIVGVRTGPLPYWEGRDSLHAIVVNGFDDKNIFINDPYFDEKEFLVSMATFALAWSRTENIAITIERR